MTNCRTCGDEWFEHSPRYYDGYCTVRCVNLADNPPQVDPHDSKQSRERRLARERYDGPPTGINDGAHINEGRAGAPWANGGWHRS